MMKLRDYQEMALTSIEAACLMRNRVLCVASTGAGKTEIFTQFIEGRLQDSHCKIVILLNDVNLLEQTKRRIESTIMRPVSVCSGSLSSRDVSAPIVVATVQTIKSIKLKIDYLIIDEAHEFNQEDGAYKQFFELNDWSDLKVIGFTATPFRAKDGYIFGEGRFFPKKDYEIGLVELINKGYLVEPIAKRPNEQIQTRGLRVTAGEYNAKDVDSLVNTQAVVNAQVKDAVPRLAGRKKIAWCCASIAHAEKVMEDLVRNGEQAVVVHSKKSDQAFDESKREFEEGDARHIVFVSMLKQGYDNKAIDAIVLLRPIKSPTLAVQVIGRGLRINEGKKDCLVLDYGRVIENIGSIDKPFVKDKRMSREQVKELEVQLKTKFCPVCLTYMPISVKICKVCQHEFYTSIDLTKKASGKSLLSTAPDVFEAGVVNVALSSHRSANGNECLKIKYRVNDFLIGDVSEYFVWNVDYARRKAIARLMELGCALKSDLVNQSMQNVLNKPTHLSYYKEGKYYKIKKLHWRALERDRVHEFSLG